ncbi:hypothetical protein NFJ02_05g123900 [Pycnococcus provasolii]
MTRLHRAGKRPAPRRPAANSAAADATAATPTLADGNTLRGQHSALAGTAAPSEVPESHLNDGDDKDTAEMDTDVVGRRRQRQLQPQPRERKPRTASRRPSRLHEALEVPVTRHLGSRSACSRTTSRPRGHPRSRSSTVINEMVARDFSAECGARRRDGRRGRYIPPRPVRRSSRPRRFTSHRSVPQRSRRSRPRARMADPTQACPVLLEAACGPRAPLSGAFRSRPERALAFSDPQQQRTTAKPQEHPSAEQHDGSGEGWRRAHEVHVSMSHPQERPPSGSPQRPRPANLERYEGS